MPHQLGRNRKGGGGETETGGRGEVGVRELTAEAHAVAC